MHQALRRSNLVPAEFVVESAFFEAEKAVLPSDGLAALVFVPRAEPSRAACIVITAAA
jgi:hypothetical protein